MTKQQQFPARPEGLAITGEWRGPRWCPQFRKHKDPDAEARKDSHPLSRAMGPIAGILTIVEAWGRAHYALDTGTEAEVVLLPEHTRLWSSLSRVSLGAHVWIDLTDATAKSKNGTSFVYDVVPFNASDVLMSTAPGRPVVTSKD